ncbi:membrane protein insertion efficiency factor YidD [Stomatohabitans albus]|uniref:membrane protein insertion efficiency factor YidD n=1 Tax=Stomatohabitans albus TaxID=3110766 RepID=UPI003AB97CC9
MRLIRWYQVMPRPRGHCRFTPTCSAYAVEAVEIHGLWRGTWLAMKRLSRCRPLGGYGFDPVPIPDQPNRK